MNSMIINTIARIDERAWDESHVSENPSLDPSRRCRISRADLSRAGPARYLRPRAKPKRLSKVKGGEEIEMDRGVRYNAGSLAAACSTHLPPSSTCPKDSR